MKKYDKYFRQPRYKSPLRLCVSPSRGNDATADGSFEKPFLTVKAALGHANKTTTVGDDVEIWTPREDKDIPIEARENIDLEK